MKKVASKIKLQMAQFRELESFAQFASDLDTDTKKVLERGARVQEILKQPQYSPIRVGEQVAILYAVNDGALDELPKESVGKWESEFRLFLESNHGKLLSDLESGWSDETEAALKEVVTEFGKLFSK